VASNLELIALQAATLFRQDAAGRLLTVNEPGDEAAARLFVGRTTEGNRWWFRHDLPDALVRDLDRILAEEPVATDLRQPLRCEQRLLDALAAHAPVANVWAGPAWYCPEGLAVPGTDTAVRVTDLSALRGPFAWIAEEYTERQPVAAVLQGGEAVAVCCSSRNAPMAAEAGLRTVEAYQRRGYAAAVVAAWAAAVRESGRLPLYSTSWDNLASQGVARKLGLVPYGADLSFG
jgi:RimJ/RimL family protein N-acetyltransferase